MVRGHRTAAQNRASVAQGPPSTNMRVPSATLHTAVVGAATYRDDVDADLEDGDVSYMYPVSAPVPRASFPVKLDARLTLERLREIGLELFADHCTDSGVPFDPPSTLAADYDIFYANADGVVQPEQPLLVPSDFGGGSVRTQVINASIKAPIHLVMVASRLWTQRHALEKAESARRKSLLDHRDAVLARSRVLAAVSAKRAEAMARNRERHMALVEEVEAAMFNALAAANQEALVTQRMLGELQKAETRWQQTVQSREVAAAELQTTKRRFFAGSCNAAVTDTSAVRDAAAPPVDGLVM